MGRDHLTCLRASPSATLSRIAGQWPSESLARLRLRQVLRREVPIDQVIEKRLHEIRAAVLVIEVVGVLPDIAGEERGLAERERVDPSQGAGGLMIAFIEHWPGSAAAEVVDRG